MLRPSDPRRLACRRDAGRRGGTGARYRGRVSLLSHLDSPASSVRGWFAEHFPNTRRCFTDANKQLRAGRRTGECPISAPPSADAGWSERRWTTW